MSALVARTLRSRLFLLAASGLLPLALVAGLVLAHASSEREREAQQTALEMSRALATAVDAELRATVGVLETLALSDALRSGRLEAFHALTLRAAASRGWRSVILSDPAGQMLLTSAQPYGTPASEPVEPQSLARAITSRAPVVGRVAVDTRQQGPAFAIRLPVLRDGQLVYVLSAVIPVDHVLTVIKRQKAPPTSVLAVYDQARQRVARSRDHPSRTPSPSLQAMLDTGAEEGSGSTTTLEGVRSHTGFSRLPSGWVVATGLTASEADGLFTALGAVGGGLLASLALSAFLAWTFARGVTEPIDALKTAARALGRGEPVHVPPLQIAELREVGAALELASSERDRAAQERHAAEAERETLLARATEALHLAQEAGRSKDEFLAMLGHELRNPLAPMATALHLMARKGEERTRPEREVMERQVAHMRRLVDDLLDVSRITSKRLVMQLQPVRLAELVRHAAQLVQPVLGRRRFSLEIAPAAEALWVQADEVRLGQVLNNLLGNAVKFTAPDGRIGLRLVPHGHQAEIVVEDDGAGMPPQVLEHVFELFYQAPQEADRARGGLGLGLSIVRSLVEMHGGSVRAHSAGPGQGSRFSLRLPLVQAPAQAQSAAAEGQAGGDGRILVVDDNHDAADTAAALLELSGYTVRVAYTPEAALARLDDFVPELALLDVGLPGMSGYELARRLRTHPRGQHCHLVALTGYGTQADVRRAQDAGFQQHLVKPAAPQELLQAVRRGLAR